MSLSVTSKFLLLLSMSAALLLNSATASAQLLRNAFAQADPKPSDVVPPPAPIKGEGDAPALNPVEGEATEKVLLIKVVAVAGNVQVRTEADKPWQPAKVEMDLPIGAEIRTGLRSICKLTIDGNHTITLDRLGVVKVLDAIKKDGRVKTDVGMKYGRTQYQVETGAVEHDARVHAPSATLAVRGSLVMVEDNAAFGSVCVVDHSNRSVYTQRTPDPTARLVAIELIRGRIEQSADNNNQPLTPAQQALKDTINDVGGRLGKANELERELIAMYPVLNGGHGGGLPPPGEFQDHVRNVLGGGGEEGGGGSEGGIVPGALQIEASWTGLNNIVVFAHDPLGAVLSTINGIPSGGQTVVRSGGPATGFAASEGSTALLIYSDGVPSGSWGVGISIAGPINGSTDFQILVHQNPDGDSPTLIHNFAGTLNSTTPGTSTGFFIDGGANSTSTP